MEWARSARQNHAHHWEKAWWCPSMVEIEWWSIRHSWLWSSCDIAKNFGHGTRNACDLAKITHWWRKIGLCWPMPSSDGSMTAWGRSEHNSEIEQGLLMIEGQWMLMTKYSTWMIEQVMPKVKQSTSLIGQGMLVAEQNAAIIELWGSISRKSLQWPSEGCSWSSKG